MKTYRTAARRMIAESPRALPMNTRPQMTGLPLHSQGTTHAERPSGQRNHAQLRVDTIKNIFNLSEKTHCSAVALPADMPYAVAPAAKVPQNNPALHPIAIAQRYFIVNLFIYNVNN
jgi:hypothetical protein